MPYYISFYILCGMLLLLTCSQQKAIKNISYLFFFILLALFPGLRGDVGQDTKNYELIYNRLGEVDSLNALGGFFIEPLFLAFTVLHGNIFDNYTAYLLSVAVLQSIALYFVAKRLYHIRTFLFVYLILFLLEFHMNVIRSGTANLIFLLALLDENKFRSRILFGFAVLVHLSVLAFLPIYLFRQSTLKLSKLKFLLAVLGIIVFLVLVNVFLGDYLLTKVYRYELFKFDFSNISTLAVLFVLLGVVSVVLSKNERYVYLAALSMFMFFYFFSPFNEIYYRLVRNFSLVFLCVACFSPMFSIDKVTIRPKVLFIFPMIFWLSLYNWISATSEFNMRVRSGEGDINYTYIPYELYVSSSRK